MKDIAEVFDLYAEEYDRWFDSPEGKTIFAMEVEAVKLLMGGFKKPFLEVGVGTGRFARELGIDFGVDPSQKALTMAKRQGIKIKKGKGEELTFEDDYFGAAFILLTLCFVEKPQKVLKEIKRVLKNGGGLIVGIINRESMWGELYMKKKSEDHPIYSYAHFYSADEIARMIDKAGLRVEAYSSTLCQPPSDKPYKEPAHKKLVDNAGFVCILAIKSE